MRIVVVALASLAIGGLGLCAPAGTQLKPLNWISDTAWAQDPPQDPSSDEANADPDAEVDEGPVIPPLPTKKDEQAAREALKRRWTEDGWVVFKAPEQLFSVALPGQPKITAKPVAGHTPLIQHDYQVDPGDGTAYHAIVFEYPEGRAPDANVDYYRRLVEAYAKGSGSSVSKQGPARIARKHGYEATTIDKSNNLIHLIDLLPSGDRIYMLVTAGPPGHARSDEAMRFRQSFHLIDPNATEDEIAEEALEQEPPTPEAPATEETAPERPLASEDDLMGEESADEAAEESVEDLTPADEDVEQPEVDGPLYGGEPPETSETDEAETEAEEAPAPPADVEAEMEPAEPEDASPEAAEEEAATEETGPADEDVTEPGPPPAPTFEGEDETSSEDKAPVPPLPDEDAETAPEPDADALEEMPPVEEKAPETEEAPSAEEPEGEATEAPEAEEPEAQPDTEEAAPEAGESDEGETEERAPEAEEEPDTLPSHPYDEDVDPDEQISI
ncbi:hypothetical protein [Methyloligella solikamskensis]|uniref:Uncharacterized protein n=1 Tax=Methyloligella solikamskensis TaxID=1177756 RepID=A0ABW3JAC6_9HYPH